VAQAKCWFQWHPPSVGFYSDIKSWVTLDGCDSLWSWCEYSQGARFGSSYDISIDH
jgi:hypothetical protein